MKKFFYTKIILLFLFINLINIIPSNFKDDNNNLSLNSTKNEIRKYLEDIYNYIIENNIVSGSDVITENQKVKDEIIDSIINNYSDDLSNIMETQLKLKSQNDKNNLNSQLNEEISNLANYSFFGSFMALMLAPAPSENSFKTFVYYFLCVTQFSASGLMIITKWFKNQIKKQNKFITNTNLQLQEQKTEINNFLVNLLISKLNEAIKEIEN